MTLRVRASSVVRHPAATFSVEVRETSRLASARVDRNSGSTALSKSLLTLCFFSGYPFLPHVDEAADFLRDETVLIRARPEEAHSTRGDPRARVAANVVCLLPNLAAYLQ